MPKGLVIILGGFSLLVLVTFGLVLKTNQPDVLSLVPGIETPISVDELGQVQRLGGHITREYSFKNTTPATIKLGRITTSCMCTQAKVVIGNQESSWFGMETPGDKNLSLNYQLLPGQSGRVVVNFNPNAHGPRGVGPFKRTIQLFFSQPRGVREFQFSGDVI